uniref:Uncharacterized protein n=1 Tax=Hubei blood fluke virus 3 TaxID=1922841 RepID=A0A1L3KPA1_9VIRU|nr:hypothetical protein 2 [Hubei blood fluke virus 3]
MYRGISKYFALLIYAISAFRYMTVESIGMVDFNVLKCKSVSAVTLDRVIDLDHKLMRHFSIPPDIWISYADKFGILVYKKKRYEMRLNCVDVGKPLTKVPPPRHWFIRIRDQLYKRVFHIIEYETQAFELMLQNAVDWEHVTDAHLSEVGVDCSTITRQSIRWYFITLPKNHFANERLTFKKIGKDEIIHFPLKGDKTKALFTRDLCGERLTGTSCCTRGTATKLRTQVILSIMRLIDSYPMIEDYLYRDFKNGSYAMTTMPELYVERDNINLHTKNMLYASNDYRNSSIDERCYDRSIFYQGRSRCVNIPTKCYKLTNPYIDEGKEICGTNYNKVIVPVMCIVTFSIFGKNHVISIRKDSIFQRILKYFINGILYCPIANVTGVPLTALTTSSVYNIVYWYTHESLVIKIIIGIVLVMACGTLSCIIITCGCYIINCIRCCCAPCISRWKRCRWRRKKGYKLIFDEPDKENIDLKGIKANGTSRSMFKNVSSAGLGLLSLPIAKAVVLTIPLTVTPMHSMNLTVNGFNVSLTVLSRIDSYSFSRQDVGIDCAIDVTYLWWCDKLSSCPPGTKEANSQDMCVTTGYGCTGCSDDYLGWPLKCLTIPSWNSREYHFKARRVSGDYVIKEILAYRETIVTLEMFGCVLSISTSGQFILIGGSTSTDTCKKLFPSIAAAATSVQLPFQNEFPLYVFNLSTKTEVMLGNDIPPRLTPGPFYCVSDPVRGVIVPYALNAESIVATGGGVVTVDSLGEQFTRSKLFRPLLTNLPGGCTGFKRSYSVYGFYNCSGGIVILVMNVEDAEIRKLELAEIESLNILTNPCSEDDRSVTGVLHLNVKKGGVVTIACNNDLCMPQQIIVYPGLVTRNVSMAPVSELMMYINSVSLHVKPECSQSTGGGSDGGLTPSIPPDPNKDSKTISIIDYVIFIGIGLLCLTFLPTIITVILRFQKLLNSSLKY